MIKEIFEKIKRDKWTIQSGNLLAPLILIIGAVIIVMTLLAMGKHTLFPYMSMWEDHIITVVLGTVPVFIIGYLVMKKLQRLYQQAVKEIAERKRSEEALQKSETKYKTLAKNIPQKIFLKDRNLVYVSCNENFARDLKIKSEEIVGKTDFDFFPEELVKKYRDDDKRIIESGKTEELEEKYIQDGKEVVVQTVKAPVKDEQDNSVGILGIFWDITDRKRAEEALQEKTHVLGERVKELNCLYALSKVIEKPEISLPEIFEELVNIIPPGWQYPEVTCARLVFEDQIWKTPNFNETIWKQSSPILGDGRRVGTLEVYYLEERPECDEGPFLKQERDLIDALAVRLRRTIQRKRAEEALRESEARYERAVNGANDGIWEWIPSTGEDYLSPRWKQLLGYEDHELPNVQASFFDQIHPEDKPRILEVVRAHFEERKPYEIELRFRCKNGEYRWFNSRGQAVWDEQGHPLSMAGSITDITERKQAEQEREKLIHELQDALAQIKKLSGLIPICASCKKIRDDNGYWNQIESYIRDHSEAEFSHGICPECMKKLYGDFLKEEDISRKQ